MNLVQTQAKKKRRLKKNLLRLFAQQATSSDWPLHFWHFPIQRQRFSLIYDYVQLCGSQLRVAFQAPKQKQAINK